MLDWQGDEEPTSPAAIVLLPSGSSIGIIGELQLLFIEA